VRGRLENDDSEEDRKEGRKKNLTASAVQLSAQAAVVVGAATVPSCSRDPLALARPQYDQVDPNKGPYHEQ